MPIGQPRKTGQDANASEACRHRMLVPDKSHICTIYYLHICANSEIVRPGARTLHRNNSGLILVGRFSSARWAQGFHETPGSECHKGACRKQDSTLSRSCSSSQSLRHVTSSRPLRRRSTTSAQVTPRSSSVISFPIAAQRLLLAVLVRFRPPSFG